MWTQEHLPETPSTVKTISRYYDTEKYKAIATAELKRTSPEVLEGGALKCAWWKLRGSRNSCQSVRPDYIQWTEWQGGVVGGGGIIFGASGDIAGAIPAEGCG